MNEDDESFSPRKLEEEEEDAAETDETGRFCRSAHFHPQTSSLFLSSGLNNCLNHAKESHGDSRMLPQEWHRLDLICTVSFISSLPKKTARKW